MEPRSLVATAAFWHELEAISEFEKSAAAQWKPEHIHRIAKKMGVDFNSDDFKAFSKQVTGKPHLDEMDRGELQKLAVALVRKMKKVQGQEKAAAAPGMLKKLPAFGKPPTPTFLKPPPSAASAVKVPSTVSAKASTASNVEGLKASKAIYGS